MLRRIRYEIIKISRAHATVHEIAYGAALGTFISIFPAFGMGMLLVVFLYRFLNFNLVAAISGSLISNVFTAPFFLLLSYEMGSLIWKSNSDFHFTTWYKHLDELGMTILIGNSIISLSSSLLIYFVVKFTVIYFRKHKMKFPLIP